MPTAPTSRDDLEGYLRNLIDRLDRVERHTHNFPVAAKPAPAPAPPFVPPTVPPSGCVPFSDDFERADLGPAWVLPPGLTYDRFGDSDTPQHLTLQTGAAIGPLTDGIETGVDFRNQTFETDDGHYVESTFTLAPGDRPGSTLAEILWYLLFDPVTWTGFAAWIVQNNDGPFGGFRFRYIFWINGGIRNDESYDYYHEWPSASHTLTMRFEASVDGVVRAFIGDTAIDIGAGDLFYQFDVTGASLGDQMGICTRVDGETMPVPRVESVTGGCLEPCLWSDDFERADGAVGSNWALGPNTSSGLTPQLFTIDAGAAVSPPFDTGPFALGSMAWAIPAVADDQFIEVVLDNWFIEGTTTYARLELFNFADAGTGNEARRSVLFQAYSDSLEIYAWTVLTDGGYTSGDYVGWFPWEDSTGPVTIRLDSLADGSQIISLNGTVVLDFVEPPNALAPTGYGQGITLEWSVGGGGRTPPRVLSVTGGCLDA